MQTDIINIIKKTFNWTGDEYEIQISIIEIKVLSEMYGKTTELKWWFDKQIECVNKVIINRWELTGEPVDAPVMYAVNDDWNEEIESHFDLVFPPGNLHLEAKNEISSSWVNDQ